MSFRTRMTMRCTIQRRTTGTDQWGQPDGSYTDHLPDHPCYAWTTTGQEIMGGADPQVVVIAESHVYVPWGSDVTEKDRIVNVTDRKGVEIFPGPMDIKSVDQRPHMLLDLTVRAST